MWVIFASAQINEKFDDGDLTSNPTWIMSSPNDFQIVNNQLKSTNTATNSSFYGSTTNTLVSNCEWEFDVNLQFNPSSANYVDVYLASDTFNLKSTVINGYFVRIGSTQDNISLYKRTGTATNSLVIGTSGILNASNHTLKIKVTHDVSNVWTLQRDLTGTGNSYIMEGSATDGSHVSSNYFGFLIKQSTASFFQKHQFDNILVTPIINDSQPPKLISAFPISSDSINVLFDESIDFNSSQNVTNYNISGIGNPLSATRDGINLKLVHLVVSTPLVNGTYTLQVSQMNDIVGNTMPSSAVSFIYFVEPIPNYKDIVFNEIYADPSPIVNLTNAEYVELYNKSLTTYNLKGLKLSDGYSTATIGHYTLLPNQYVIICPMADTAQFTELGYLNRIGVSSFPSLNNTSDHLFLKTSSNAIIDSLSYFDTWYKNSIKKEGGYSLEQINPNQVVTCLLSDNWIASNDADGGTPGFINSVYSLVADTIGPRITKVSVIDSLHILVQIEDGFSKQQLTNLTNYSIFPFTGAPISVFLTSSTDVTLVLPTPLKSGTNYTLMISGITDCYGNLPHLNQSRFSYYHHKPYDVVFNELMSDPDPSIGLPDVEFVELKNRTSFDIHLKNWTLSTLSSSKKMSDVIIKADSLMVFTNAGNAEIFFKTCGIKVYEITGFPSLINDGTTLTLRDTNGVMIHSLTYSKDWYQSSDKEEGGFSLEQIDAGNPCGEIRNWRASEDKLGGTPGKINSVSASNLDRVFPQLQKIDILLNDTILLTFTESLDSVRLSNPKNYLLDNGLGEPIYVQPVSPQFKKVKLKFRSGLLANVVYHCSVLSDVCDCSGNPLINSSLPFALPQAPIENDIVINEILFDPNSGCVDFVELYNKSNKTIDLKDLRIGSMDTISGALFDTQIITHDGYLLFPGHYVVLSENQHSIKQHYFSLNPNEFVDMIDLPAMNTDRDVVTISDKHSKIIDNFIYDEAFHFPLLVSKKGISLERIDFNRRTNDRTNWNSASETVRFATPSYQNSQYLKVEMGSGFYISNPLFSPDNDGYYDVLNISYELTETTNIANVYVYDSDGRLVRHLIKNQPLTQQGTFSWDGMTDGLEKASIGIYVIYIEVFDFSGKVRTHKLGCTLAGKL